MKTRDEVLIKFLSQARHVSPLKIEAYLNQAKSELIDIQIEELEGMKKGRRRMVIDEKTEEILGESNEPYEEYNNIIDEMKANLLKQKGEK